MYVNIRRPADVALHFHFLFESFFAFERRALNNMEFRGFRLRFCTRPPFCDRPLVGLASTSISTEEQCG